MILYARSILATRPLGVTGLAQPLYVEPVPCPIGGMVGFYTAFPPATTASLRSDQPSGLDGVADSLVCTTHQRVTFPTVESQSELLLEKDVSYWAIFGVIFRPLELAIYPHPSMV